MAQKQEIEVEIAPDGETRVHIKGIKGKSCMKYADLLKKVLGRIKEIKNTSEYYEPDAHIKIDVGNR